MFKWFWYKFSLGAHEMRSVETKVEHESQESVSSMFLPHFDVFCDSLLNRLTATWNIFVLWIEEKKINTNLPRTAWLGWRIFASLGIYKVTNATFPLCFFFSSLSYFQWRQPLREVIQRFPLLKA